MPSIGWRRGRNDPSVPAAPRYALSIGRTADGRPVGVSPSTIVGVIGTPQSGRTTFLREQLAQAQRLGLATVAIDPLGDLAEWTRSVSGQVITLAPGGPSINPFEPAVDDLADQIELVMPVLAALLNVDLIEEDDDTLLRQALGRMYELPHAVASLSGLLEVLAHSRDIGALDAQRSESLIVRLSRGLHSPFGGALNRPTTVDFEAGTALDIRFDPRAPHDGAALSAVLAVALAGLAAREQKKPCLVVIDDLERVLHPLPVPVDDLLVILARGWRKLRPGMLIASARPDAHLADGSIVSPRIMQRVDPWLLLADRTGSPAAHGELRATLAQLHLNSEEASVTEWLMADQAAIENRLVLISRGSVTLLRQPVARNTPAVSEPAGR